ncbi:MAG TPA: PD-(D/E)XK nuclease family protein [Planctomycetota bacterium]|nr:PD-(D/E)XK nuclease family protein [Planctomycetota bacterium]
MRAPLENEFSWSLSRARTFEDCPLKYWFHYYGSWGGWEPDAPPEARELYLLKNLTNLHLIAGDTVHRAIQRALEDHARHKEPDPEKLVSWCKAEMQRAMHESMDEAWRERPKQCARLFEHHYGPRPQREFLVRIAKKIGDSIRRFFSSPAFALIRETDPGEWLPMETLDTFQFEGTKVYAVPDFACRHRGEVILLDWKTGQPDERNADQVVLYALFAAARWGADPDRVRGAPVYLLNGGGFEPRSVTPDDRARVADMVRRSIAAMRDRLKDPVTNAAERGAFAPSPGHACRSCNFRGVCAHAR